MPTDEEVVEPVVPTDEEYRQVRRWESDWTVEEY